MKIKTRWTASSTLDNDRSGIGVFEIPGQVYSIKFDDFEDYFFILKAMDVNTKLASDEYLNNLKNHIYSIMENY